MNIRKLEHHIVEGKMMDDKPMRCIDLWYKIDGETGRAFINHEFPETDDKIIKQALKAIKEGYIANKAKGQQEDQANTPN